MQPKLIMYYRHHRCSHAVADGCRASLVFRNNTYTIVNGDHNHEDDDGIIILMEMENWCKDQAIADPHRDLHSIWQAGKLR